MSDRPALAFPGQGIPTVAIAAVLDRHDDPLVDRLAAIIATRDWAGIDTNDTRVAQPAIFTASLVAAQAALTPEAVELVVGHSVGEFTALAFAGAIDPLAALDLVALRGELCASGPERPGKMAAIMNLDADALEWLRRLAIARSGGVLETAAVNGRSQVVVSGDAAAVDEAVAACGELNGIAALLPIGGAFHSPLMYPVVGRLRAALAEVEVGAASVPVMSSVDCRVRSSADEMQEERELLARSLVMPVRWHESMTALAARGVGQAVDAGPGETLRKLGKRGGAVRFIDAAEVAR